ncbi:MAG: hypothetical protein V7717_04890 [Porticoccaceae bacterium]
MKWYWAILFTVAIFSITIFASGVVGVDLTLFLIIGTAIWVALDSNQIGLKKYKSGISYGPIVVFIAVALLWIFGFPWYLHVRYKIQNGLAELKEPDAPSVQESTYDS